MEATSSKASRTLGFLHRNFRDCNKSVREQAYTTMVRPTLEYASAAWDPSQGNWHRTDGPRPINFPAVR